MLHRHTTCFSLAADSNAVQLKPPVAIGSGSFLFVGGTAEWLSPPQVCSQILHHEQQHSCTKGHTLKQNRCGGKMPCGCRVSQTLLGKSSGTSHPLWVMDSSDRMKFRWQYPEETARPIFGLEIRVSSRVSWEEGTGGFRSVYAAVGGRHSAYYVLLLIANG